MELRDYLRIARRRWRMILSVVAICVIAAVGLTARATPLYASTARVFISTAPDTTTAAYQGSLFSEQRVQSYAGMMQSLELAQNVVSQLGLNESPQALSGQISATAVPNTVLLDVTVTNPDPALAQKINNAVMDQLKLMVSQIETPPGGQTPLLKATVIDPPRLPTSPVSPKPTTNVALGLILGLLLGFGLAILREILDNTVKSVDDVAALEEVPPIGGLPFDTDVVKHPLITTLNSHAPRLEAHRVLRTNIQFLEVDSPSKVLVVTSSVPREGKSTTAVNLAIALASTNKRVLLIDGDLRRPRVADLLGLEQAVGLTSLLVGTTFFDAAVQRHVDSGLQVLASGTTPPNPAELLQSKAMHDLLENLRHRYDIILIDAPPLLPVTDAALLAAEADGALLVVRYGKTTKDQVTGAIARLTAVDASAVGVVMNMVPAKTRAYGGNAYGYGYGYGYAPTPIEAKAKAGGGKSAGKRSSKSSASA